MRGFNHIAASAAAMAIGLPLPGFGVAPLPGMDTDGSAFGGRGKRKPRRHGAKLKPNRAHVSRRARRRHRRAA